MITALVIAYLTWSNRVGGRVAEGARLESVYTATYRGFESLSTRHRIYEHIHTSLGMSPKQYGQWLSENNVTELTV